MFINFNYKENLANYNAHLTEKQRNKIKEDEKKALKKWQNGEIFSTNRLILVLHEIYCQFD